MTPTVQGTRLLVLVGMGLMVLSYPVYKLGIEPELYPFFYWRLYSAPSPAEGAETYRIYTKEVTTDSTAQERISWRRQEIGPVAAYSRRGYTFHLTSLVQDALSDSPYAPEARRRLASFVRYVAPGAESYRVVVESFQPFELLDAPQRFDTTTVFVVGPGEGAARPVRLAE